MTSVKNIAVSFCFAFLMFGVPALAQDTSRQDQKKRNDALTIYTFVQPEKLDRNLGGGYGRFLRYLQDNSDFEIKVIPSTLIRSLRGLTVNKNSCFFPIAPKSIEDRIIPQFNTGEILYSKPLDIVSGYVFQRADTPLAKSFDDYKGKKIASVREIRPEQILGVEFQLVPVIDDVTAAKMLARKRADYILGWYPDTPLIMNKLNFDDLTYNKDLMVAELTTHFACRDSNQTKKLLTYINMQMTHLKKTGVLKYMLNKYARIVPVGGKGYHTVPNLNYKVEMTFPE